MLCQQHGNTPLQIACKKGHYNMIQYLLDPAIVNSDYKVQYILQYILQLDAFVIPIFDLMNPDIQGDTALMTLLKRTCEDETTLRSILLQEGIDLDQQGVRHMRCLQSSSRLRTAAL
jgi:ankyrin repeat protein